MDGDEGSTKMMSVGWNSGWIDYLLRGKEYGRDSSRKISFVGRNLRSRTWRMTDGGRREDRGGCWDPSIEAIMRDLVGTRQDPESGQFLEIGLEGGGITGEILGRTELGWIEEDGDDGVSLGGERMGDQLEVTVV